MEFLQPSLLWGILAVAIPIAIHLWHQKKGNVLAWAATQWLLEKNQQSQRGLRLDNLLLLVLRCLMLIVLALMLAEPLFRKINPSSALRKIHLVEPDAYVVDNYRFELEEAQQKGEPVYWLTPALPSANDLTPPQGVAKTPSSPELQTALNRMPQEGSVLHLYVKNERSLVQLPRMQTPPDFQLHAVSDTLSRKVRPYRLVAGNQKLYIDAENRLRVADTDPQVAFAPGPVGKGALRVSLDLKNPDEQKTVAASLRALAEVYTLEADLREGKSDEEGNDLVVTDQLPPLPSPATLYVVRGQTGHAAFPNVIYWPDTLTPQSSSAVANGRFPEWLGTQVLYHAGLSGDAAPLTRQELTTLFKPSKPASGASSAGTQQLFFIILLVLSTLERGMALYKNA